MKCTSSSWLVQLVGMVLTVTILHTCCEEESNLNSLHTYTMFHIMCVTFQDILWVILGKKCYVKIHVNINQYTPTSTVLFQDTVQCQTISVLTNHLHTYSPSGQQYSLIIHFRDNGIERTQGWRSFWRINSVTLQKNYVLWYDLKTGFLLLCSHIPKIWYLFCMVLSDN